MLLSEWPSDISSGYAKSFGLLGDRAGTPLKVDARGALVASRLVGALQRAAQRADALRNSTASGKASAARSAARGGAIALLRNESRFCAGSSCTFSCSCAAVLGWQTPL